MAVAPSDPPGCGSQFFITLKDDIDYLDGKHAVFGRVVEGEDVLDKLNEVFVDVNGRPLKDIRIRHIEILGEWIKKKTNPPSLNPVLFDGWLTFLLFTRPPPPLVPLSRGSIPRSIRPHRTSIPNQTTR